MHVCMCVCIYIYIYIHTTTTTTITDNNNNNNKELPRSSWRELAPSRRTTRSRREGQSQLMS